LLYHCPYPGWLGLYGALTIPIYLNQPGFSIFFTFYSLLIENLGEKLIDNPRFFLLHSCSLIAEDGKEKK